MVKSERDQHSKEIFRASQVDPSNRKSKTSFVIHQAIKAIREVQGGTGIKDAKGEKQSECDYRESKVIRHQVRSRQARRRHVVKGRSKKLHIRSVRRVIVGNNKRSAKAII